MGDEKLTPLQVEEKKLVTKRLDLAEGERLLRQAVQRESEVRRRETRIEQIKILLEQETAELENAQEELAFIKSNHACKTQV